ncbi:MAG: hypothetical protein M2R45_03098 [Verrucomicrobia subdivision 3 bacterium]|nr:hypothetical protein [Limisphaerales bacterium]MCS1413166.1 hypothetical protein [Limisphaerales bacterium]
MFVTSVLASVIHRDHWPDLDIIVECGSLLPLCLRSSPAATLKGKGSKPFYCFVLEQPLGTARIRLLFVDCLC